MTKQFILRIVLIFCLTAALKVSHGQNTITAFISQEGVLTFRINKSGFYVYTSQKGKITGYGALGNGTISYDYSGRVDKIGTLSISYDYSGRIDGVGTTSISYDYSGRVDKIGATNIAYDYSGNIDNLGGQRISYNYSGKVDKVGSASISYNYSGNVDNIKDEEGIIVFRPKLGAGE